MILVMLSLVFPLKSLPNRIYPPILYSEILLTASVSGHLTINIGDDVTLAPRVHILAHDASTKRHLGYTKIGLVEIGNKTFIGAGTIIMPNTKIGTNCIIGAGSLVTKDIPDNSIAVGVPAKVINTTDKYLAKEKEQMKHRPVYDSKFTVREGITDEQKQKMIEDLKDGIGYVE